MRYLSLVCPGAGEDPWGRAKSGPPPPRMQAIEGEEDPLLAQVSVIFTPPRGSSSSMRDYATSSEWMVTPFTTRFTVPVGLGVSGVLPTFTELSRLTTWATITNGSAA